MSEYTPTTEEIIEAWTDGSVDVPESLAQFYRWLAAHDAEVRAGVVAEEPEWQYSYVERIGRFGDVRERVTFDSLGAAERYLRDNADSVIGWNREVKKRDHKTARVEKRQMNIGPWVPVKQDEAETR